jgi:hypothetical protein
MAMRAGVSILPTLAPYVSFMVRRVMTLEVMQLWESTLGPKGDGDEAARERLRVSLNSFRGRIEHLAASIGGQLPWLTVHDITHLDALWRIAREVAGGDYPINPAEAYVLGGTFLLHDAAHTVAAFPGGLSEIRASTTWRDFVAQRFEGVTPAPGSSEEATALFQTLRHLHATQAHKLPYVSWPDPKSCNQVFLIEDQELREYYGDVIGEISASHHWPSHKVAEVFEDRIIPAPAFLLNSEWTVDALKIAYLLRTADAAHIDSIRAPWFLFALRQPSGISEKHWRFQSKMGQPVRNSEGHLRISSGAPFESTERQAWWLAYDAAQMIDRELRDAYAGLRDAGRQPFAAVGVLGANSPEAFARQVRTKGWEPVDVGPTVGNVPKLIAALGGSALYGNDKTVPVRELLQNSMDAVRALRALGVLQEEEGEVEVVLEVEDGQHWIHVTDNGIGMSRHVLTNVLLDFGNSLWRSDDLREELPGLASTAFKAVGQFGIGFYSTFMLGSRVQVTTRRFDRKPEDNADQWQLTFEDGLASRPVLSQPTPNERLTRHGTRISVECDGDNLQEALRKRGLFSFGKEASIDEDGMELLSTLVARLAPASDVRLYASFRGVRHLVVSPHDWKSISDEALSARLGYSTTRFHQLVEDGQVIGRVSPEASFYQNAVVVLNGLRCSSAQHLSGLIQAQSNNVDAKRTEARMAGSLETWLDWARRVVEEGKLSMNQLLRLHPFFPGHDFAVWNLEGSIKTLAELDEFLVNRNEVLVHDGEVTYEDYDEMGSDYFDEIEYEDGLLCLPALRMSEEDFPLSLGLNPVDYRELLEKSLTRLWGKFDCERDDARVGFVRGAEINRDVYRYSKIVEHP